MTKVNKVQDVHGNVFSVKSLTRVGLVECNLNGEKKKGGRKLSTYVRFPVAKSDIITARGTCWKLAE